MYPEDDAGPKVLLLSSGGIDSTALLDFYLRRKNNVECLHFQYGQKNALSEKEAFHKITAYYKVTGKVIETGFIPNVNGLEIGCRNVLFVMIAASVSIDPIRIAIGIHEGSRYYDCSKRFLEDCQRILDGYYFGTVKLEAPFIEFNKTAIIAYCKNFNVPVNLTYSCLTQNFQPCGQCPTCLDNKELRSSSI